MKDGERSEAIQLNDTDCIHYNGGTCGGFHLCGIPSPDRKLCNAFMTAKEYAEFLKMARKTNAENVFVLS